MYRLISNGFMRTLVATAMFAATTAPFLQVAQASTASNNKPLLVALGDSITFGYNLPDTVHNTQPSASAFPVQIGQDLNFQVADLGIPGWTSADLLNALQTPNFSRPIRQANAITLDIGSNDLLHLASTLGLLQQAAANPTATITLTTEQSQAFQTAIAQFGKNLVSIVAQIRQTTDAPIILYNLYDPFPDNTGLHTATEQFQQVENQIIAQVAASTKNVVVADAHTAFDHNQFTDVRVASGDVHPTVAGQKVLAQTGEAVIKPFLSKLSIAVNADETVALSTLDAGPTGGTFTGGLGASQFTLDVPAGALNEGTEVDLTSQSVVNLEKLIPNGESGVVEFGVNFMSGATFSHAYTLTIQNSNISAQAGVYQVVNGKLVPFTAATVKAGSVVIPASAAADFVVLAPQRAAVKGGTLPVTGLPFASEAASAFVFVVLGGSLMFIARRKTHAK